MSGPILITGAAGYIGSQFVETLILDSEWKKKGLGIVLLDDLSTGRPEFIEALEKLAMEEGWSRPVFEKCSLLDASLLQCVFERHRPSAVLHFAARISVAESVEKPELYFENNVEGSKNLLHAMAAAGTGKLVFSSTAAVYGSVSDPMLSAHPLKEETPLAPINPYGETKLLMEQEIEDARKQGVKSFIFRYFNAAGASFTGRFGESHDPETHLIPLLLRSVLSGNQLKVFGNRYPTRDGTCIRDYIHVADLADAHLRGLSRLMDGENGGVYNLGTSEGTSVFEVIEAAARVTGKTVPFGVHPPRAGDSPVLVADASRARAELGWVPRHSSIETILKTALDWEMRKA